MVYIRENNYQAIHPSRKIIALRLIKKLNLSIKWLYLRAEKINIDGTQLER